MTAEQLPRVSQKLRLTCQRCGDTHTYDVGAIFYDQQGEGESAKTNFSFTNYFRCRECQSAGPWDVADYLKLIGLTLRAKVQPGYQGVFAGRTALFDGTFTQTPADGEDHLLRRIAQDPRNAFLCTRLGNLLRGCREQSRAAKWYEQAVTLDPGDIEARYHLYSFAVDDSDLPAAILHGPLLAQHLLAGRTTNKEELTHGIALSLADTLRQAPPEFRAEFLGQPKPTPEPPERTFIRTLLEQNGDEDGIVRDAADRLLVGEAEPEQTKLLPPAMDLADDDDGPGILLVPSLCDVVAKEGLNAQKLTVAVEADGQGHIRVEDRHSIRLYDGMKLGDWPVASLPELFRGTKLPPADIAHYPPTYCPYFFFIERHLLTICDAAGDRTDQEMEEIYSALRRRPGHKSLGPTHDFLWQVSALMLGRYVLSQAEFEAIMGTLERSARKWALRPISRNYVPYLRSKLP